MLGIIEAKTSTTFHKAEELAFTLLIFFLLRHFNLMKSKAVPLHAMEAHGGEEL
jgi:hypothetical protein